MWDDIIIENKGERSMKILNFGSINIDKVYSVKDFVRAGETISSLDYKEYPGGKGLNQSIAMARAGLEVYHVGKIGEEGTWIKDLMMEENIACDYTLLSDKKTGHAIIQVSSEGENSIIVEGGANRDFLLSEIKQIISNFEKGDYLVIQNEINNTKEVIDIAYEKGMKILFNPSPISKIMKEIDFNKIDYLIMNETETYEISCRTNLKEAIKELLSKYKNIKLVITLGSKGVEYYDKEVSYKQESFKTNVVDTTAAGDTFLGYFVATLINSNNVKKSLETASKAASIAVSKPGATDSIPRLEEVVVQN